LALEINITEEIVKKRFKKTEKRIIGLIFEGCTNLKNKPENMGNNTGSRIKYFT
jgi:hypothetical protein